MRRQTLPRRLLVTGLWFVLFSGLMLPAGVEPALAATARPIDLEPPAAVPITPDGQIPLILETSPPYGAVMSRVEELGGRIQHAFTHMPALSVTVPAGRVSELLDHPQVVAASRQKLMRPAVATVDLPGIGRIEDGKVRGLDLGGRTVTIPTSELTAGRAAKRQGASQEELKSFLLYEPVTRAHFVWEEAGYGAGTVVVVVDTGIYPEHPLIEGSVIGGMNLVPEDEERLIDIDEDGVPDGHSFDWDAIENDDHGTFVSGLVAGHGDLFLPIDSRFAQSIAVHSPESVAEVDTTMVRVSLMGAAPAASLYGIKVFPYDGGGAPDARVAEAIDRVIEMKRTGQLAADVINLSLGGPSLWDGRDPVDRAIEAARQEGIIVVAAAGNDGPSLITTGTPANAASALTAGGAVDPIHFRVGVEQLIMQVPVGFGATIYPHDLQVVDFSGRGETADERVKPDILATALLTFSSSLEDLDEDGLNDSIGYGFSAGTSFSAPTISGAVALLAAFTRAVGGEGTEFIPNALMRRAKSIAHLSHLAEVEQGLGFLRLPEAAEMLRNHRATHAPIRNPSNRHMRWVRLSEHGEASAHCPELAPGETFTFLLRVWRSASRIEFSFPEVHLSGPENPVVGDQLVVYIHSSKRGGHGDYVFAEPALEPGESFVYEFPEPGNIRLTFAGAMTNWGSVAGGFDLRMINMPPVPDLILNGRIENEGAWESVIEVPAGKAALGLALRWTHDWSEFPTYDLDFYVEGPFEAQYRSATLRSPELLLIENPPPGRWTLRVVDVGTVIDREYFRVTAKFFDAPPTDKQLAAAALAAGGEPDGAPGLPASSSGIGRPAFAMVGLGPNPFRPGPDAGATFGFELGGDGGQVGVRIYDASGRLVRSLGDEVLPAGVHSLTWDGLDASGRPVGSGIYLYRIDSPVGTLTRKLVVAR